MKIEKLTDAQKAKFPEYVAKWKAIGLSCEPVDFEKAKAAATRCYELAKLEPPKYWVLCDSPLSAGIAASMLKGNEVWDSVRASVRASVGDSVRASVWASVRASVRASVWDSVGDSVRASVGDSVWASVRASVWDSVGDSVWDSVGASVWDSVGASVGEMAYGSHEAGWFSFYDFMRLELGLDSQTELIQGLTELAKQCGWWAPYRNVCIIQQRHNQLHLNREGRLHNESGIACGYRDGWGVWAINGIRVDEQIVMRPETQTIEQINGESNQDIRSIRIERFGWPRYIKETNATCVDSRRNEIEGTMEALYRTRAGSRLVVTCPTKRIFALGVPEQVATCQQAQNWLGGDELNASSRCLFRT